MKITICGSIKTADKLVEIYEKLEKLGHQPMMHEKMFAIGRGELDEVPDGVEHAEVKRKNNYIKWWHDLIVSGGAILVCNFDRKGIKNYIGGNTLMEMGFAHVSGKKIFLLNPIPEDVSYADEIKAMADEVLSGDLSKIN
jgi:hypothetical protein